jgi:hypothetical protein
MRGASITFNILTQMGFTLYQHLLLHLGNHLARQQIIGQHLKRKDGGSRHIQQKIEICRSTLKGQAHWRYMQHAVVQLDLVIQFLNREIDTGNMIGQEKCLSLPESVCRKMSVPVGKCLSLS